jgi:transcriptional regulator with XRE-family HTH domain
VSSEEGAHERPDGLGAFIRRQRRLANMSLRDLAGRTAVSNPYLSQVERGLHEPSIRVLKAIALALDLSAETLLLQAGLLDDAVATRLDSEAGATAAAIRAESQLTEDQKLALLAVYRSYIAANSGHKVDLPAAGAA